MRTFSFIALTVTIILLRPGRLFAELPPGLIPRGAFARTELLRYCEPCPNRDRFDEDFSQFMLLALATNGVYRRAETGFWNPSTDLWKENIGRFRFYDRDRWQTDILLHPAAATATYLTLRERGYSRAGAAFFLFTALTAREFAVKAWGKPVSMDDPLIFAASGLLFGTLIEEFTPWRRYFAQTDPGSHLSPGMRLYWTPTRITLQW